MVAHCFEIVGRCSMQTIVLLQNSTKEPSLGNILTIDGYFNCVTSCVKVLGWLKKKKKKERNKERKKDE